VILDFSVAIPELVVTIEAIELVPLDVSNPGFVFVLFVEAVVDDGLLTNIPALKAWQTGSLAKVAQAASSSAGVKLAIQSTFSGLARQEAGRSLIHRQAGLDSVLVPPLAQYVRAKLAKQ
jgi:hypothetical protein